MGPATVEDETKDVQPAAPVYHKVRQGQFIQLQTCPVQYNDGRTGYTQNWFRCNDVNVTLHRDLSAIGLALRDFDYEAGVGATTVSVKSFTLRQFWQDADKIQVAYTRPGLHKWLEDLKLRLNKEVPAALWPLIDTGIKEFEKRYKGRLPDSY